MEQQQIRNQIRSYLSSQYNCKPDIFDKNGIFYTVATDAIHFDQNPVLKIMCMGKSTVITASSSILESVKKLTLDKTREELFELPLVYGQSIYYIPDGNIPKTLPSPFPNLTYSIYERDDISCLKPISSKFSNSIDFDSSGKTNTCIVFCAKFNNEIIGIASAAIMNDSIWEVGIDVLDDFRKQGIATYLIGKLTRLILEKNIIPIYCAASSNVLSQMVAHACNYKPCWVESYKNILDSSSVYNNILKNIILFIDL